MQWDVVVVGAGAAGLLAAAQAADRGRKTLLLEKNPRPGTKILMSGGARCNLTQATDRRGIVEAFGSQGRFLHSALAALSPADLVDLIEAEGVATKSEETGKIFPVSNQASDIVEALLKRLRRSGCKLALEEPVLKLTRGIGGFQLVTSRQTILAKRVIVTTGGKSYAGCGTSGDGYPWLSTMGHEIAPLHPALTPVTTNISWIANLRGLTIADVAIRVIDNQDGRSISLAEARNSFLFTHFGLSGPAVLDISRAVSAHGQPQSLQLECDFLPGMRAEDLQQQLRADCAAEGKKQLAGVLSRLLPRRLVESLLDQAGLSDLRAAELSKNHCQRLIASIKQRRIPLSGTRGFKKAEVTAGGVSLDQIDSRTMQSKIVPNLYVAGELLDLDGPIGGYNFQAAFSTAWLAGNSV